MKLIDFTKADKIVLKAVVIIILLILIFGCKTKNTITTVTSKDSVRVEKILTITLSSLDEIVIEEPCDSLGHLKPFKYSTTSGKVKTTLQAKGDTLYLTKNVDSIVDLRIKEYKLTLTDKKERIVITKRYIPKWCWYSLGLNSLLLIWTFKRILIKFII